MEPTLVRYLENFRKRGDETAYLQHRGYRISRWTYCAVAEEASRFARELESRAIGKGDRVLLWGENCAEWVVAFLGCVLRGAVVVPMDEIASPDFAHRVANQVEAKLYLCGRGMNDKLPGVPGVVLEDLPAAIARHAGGAYPCEDSRREDVVEIVFTSGTTAEPKGVIISHKNVLANLEPLETEIAKYLRYERPFHPLRFLNLLPLSHVFGQFLGVFVPQLLGATVIFQDTLNPSETIRTIRRERVSVLVAVPRILESLRGKLERDMLAQDKLDRFRRDFQASQTQHFIRRWWRFRKIHSEFGWKFWAFISGGAALDSQTEQFWGRLGFAVIQGYGLTETTSMVSVNHPFKMGRGSIGKVLPGREIKLAEDGEILVRGENIAAGYLQGREASRISGGEGWFHTGDMGELDAEGNLYFKGRRKNVIVTPEGMNIFPEDLEASLRRQPEVRDCIVVGLETGGNAEPCAVLILKDRGLDPEAIVRRANQPLAEFQHMRRWFVWQEEDFPRTTTQKPRLGQIRDVVQSKMSGTNAVAKEVDTLADLISSITGRQGVRLKPESGPASDLNLSSMERVELLGALEDRYQIDINESAFAAASTVGDLESLLRQAEPDRTVHSYPRWAQAWPARIIRIAVYYLLSWPATVIMARPAIRGRENLKELRGPLLIVSNHVTQVDIGFILLALPLRIRHRLAVAMLGEMLHAMRHPPDNLSFFRRQVEKLSYFLVVALFNVFPLPQQTGFRQSFEFAGECADRGYSILVFPEGRRTLDGTLSPFRAGIGILARDLKLPVLPVRIDGLFEMKRRGGKFAAPGAVRVSIGSPKNYGGDTCPEEAAQDLERCMRELEWS